MSDAAMPIKPSKRTVEKLLRELCESRLGVGGLVGITADYRRLDREVGDLEKKLLSDPDYQLLCERRNLARDEAWKASRLIADKAIKLRRIYLAKGMTKMVLEQLENLVQEVNSL